MSRIRGLWLSYEALFQPLLAGGILSGLSARLGRGVHRWVGAALVGAVVVHVGGLWVTTPPDVIDALTFTAPTWFSVWGVLAMWGVFATACVAVLRRRVPLLLTAGPKRETIESAAALVGERLGWDESRQRDEIEALVAR